MSSLCLRNPSLDCAVRRGHDYVTIAVDLDQRRVLFACEGKDASCIESAAADLRAHGGDPLAVTDVACDMSAAFTKGITDHRKRPMKPSTNPCHAAFAFSVASGIASRSVPG